MHTSPSFQQLRPALLADAFFSGASALLLLFGAGFLASLMALPEGLLRYVGLALVPYALFVAFVATRRAIPKDRPAGK